MTGQNCPLCSAEDSIGVNALLVYLGTSEKLIPEDGNYCARFFCGHRWHLETDIECDCPDYIRPVFPPKEGWN